MNLPPSEDPQYQQKYDKLMIYGPLELVSIVQRSQSKHLAKVALNVCRDQIEAAIWLRDDGELTDFTYAEHLLEIYEFKHSL